MAKLDGTCKELSKVRRYELDWLRVLAFLLLIFYHVGMYYIEGWGWHVKSEYQSDLLRYPMLWSNPWRMSLLFLISGSATVYMINKMSPWKFFLTRHTRLLLPLLFGMGVVVVPQVFIEAKYTGVINGDYGYLRFWKDYLDQDSSLFADHKTIGSYHFTWNHLWYLAYIFSYSIIALIIYSVLKPVKLWKFSICRIRFPSIVVLVLLPIVFLTLNSALLYDRFEPTHALFDDFYNHGRYGFAFSIGVLLAMREDYWRYLFQIRAVSLLIAICSYSLLISTMGVETILGFEVAKLVKHLIQNINAWLWVITICGWAQGFLSCRSVIISYLNKAVYCYYILHQTLILVIAYQLDTYKLGPIIEPLTLIILTFIACGAGYELVKRLPMLRSLLGVSLKV